MIPVTIPIVGTPPLFKGGDHDFQGFEEGGIRIFSQKGGVIARSMKKIRKKYSTVLAVEPERTDGRTHRSEFIGSFRKLKLPGNQLKC